MDYRRLPWQLGLFSCQGRPAESLSVRMKGGREGRKERRRKEKRWRKGSIRKGGGGRKIWEKDEGRWIKRRQIWRTTRKCGWMNWVLNVLIFLLLWKDWMKSVILPPAGFQYTDHSWVTSNLEVRKLQPQKTYMVKAASRHLSLFFSLAQCAHILFKGTAAEREGISRYPPSSCCPHAPLQHSMLTLVTAHLQHPPTTTHIHTLMHSLTSCWAKTGQSKNSHCSELFFQRNRGGENGGGNAPAVKNSRSSPFDYVIYRTQPEPNLPQCHEKFISEGLTLQRKKQKIIDAKKRRSSETAVETFVCKHIYTGNGYREEHIIRETKQRRNKLQKDNVSVSVIHPFIRFCR